MNRSRFPIFGLVLLFLSAWSARSNADCAPSVNPGPHRLSLGVSTDLILPGINRDANWAEVTIAPGLAAGYAYRLMPWLELGAQAAYWSAEQRAADVFIPALSLRFFASVAHSRRTELGLTGRAGLLNEYVSASGYEKTWHGSAFTAAGDVRTWLSSTAALQVSIELTRGSAYSHRDDGYSALNTSYASLGLRVGLVIAP